MVGYNKVSDWEYDNMIYICKYDFKYNLNLSKYVRYNKVFWDYNWVSRF